ncbi:metal ABC transporter substrate-binding protein, partial [Pseudomonas gingeri]|nr:metal ABC transporter substrate-binding protein [Pseudomonas gingeri]
MPNLRPLTLALVLSGLFSSTLCANPAPLPAAPQQDQQAGTSARPVRILASLPVTHGLGEILLKDTGVVLQRAADANLPGSRQSAYFSGRGAAALQKLASNADAVIGLRSLWPDDPLYPMARRSNV